MPFVNKWLTHAIRDDANVDTHMHRPQPQHLRPGQKKIEEES